MDISEILVLNTEESHSENILVVKRLSEQASDLRMFKQSRDIVRLEFSQSCAGSSKDDPKFKHEVGHITSHEVSDNKTPR